MTTPAWPAGLPLPNVSGFSMTSESVTLNTDMDNGSSRSRRLFTKVPVTVSAAWRMTSLQFAAFEWWHLNTIAGGAGEFTITLMNGQGPQTMTARFVGPWEAVALKGGHMQVTGQLLVKSRPVTGGTV